MKIVEDALKGNKLAIGRIIKMIENDEDQAKEALTTLYPLTGHSFFVGITGPPGSGKSTLISALITAYRKRGSKIGVLAIDPSSQLTGGAILGDRIRMKRHTLDPEVFIRSIAARGSLGGISRTTKGALIVLDALKYDVIFIETVGVGQSEMDISFLADMTVVVCIPGMGDALQVLKAGNLEIADLFVVNKADKPEADEVVNHLDGMLDMRIGTTIQRRPSIIKTAALEERGIEKVVTAMDTFRSQMKSDPELIARSARHELRYIESITKDLAAEKIWQRLSTSNLLAETLVQVQNRMIDPYSAAQALLKDLLP
jgi:LAO/AO transport system kinase